MSNVQDKIESPKDDASNVQQTVVAEPPRPASSENADFEFLLDIPLIVTVELGRTKLLVNDLLKLGQGSVIELDKLAGEPLEILVNNRLIAKGEVVVADEKFGVRLTDILSPSERVVQLK